MFGDPDKATTAGQVRDSAIIADLQGGTTLYAEDHEDTVAYRVLKISAVTQASSMTLETKPLPLGLPASADHTVRQGDLL